MQRVDTFRNSEKNGSLAPKAASRGKFVDSDAQRHLMFRPLLYMVVLLVIVFAFPFGKLTIIAAVIAITLVNVELVVYLRKKFSSEPK